MREQIKGTHITNQEKPINPDSQSGESGMSAGLGGIIEDFGWVLDDNLLRDEGVRYGLMGAPVNHKMATIKNYYERKIAEAEQSAVSNKQWAGQLAEGKINYEEERDRLRGEITALATNTPRSDHQLIRFILMFLVYTVMVVFCFFAIYEWMGNSWIASLLITIGVYILGGFSMFYRTAIMYNAAEIVKNDSERELWKSKIEEFILPAIATLFVVLWGEKEATIAQTIIFSLLLYALLLFAGRGLLKSLFSMVRALEIFKDDKQRRRRNTELLREKREVYEKCLQKIRSIEEQIRELETDIRQAALDIASYKRTQEMKTSCFLSEYELAQTTSKNMTARDVNSLLIQ